MDGGIKDLILEYKKRARLNIEITSEEEKFYGRVDIALIKNYLHNSFPGEVPQLVFLDTNRNMVFYFLSDPEMHYLDLSVLNLKKVS